MNDGFLSTTPGNADGPTEPLSSAKSFVDVLRLRSRHQGGREAFLFASERPGAEVQVTYGELDTRARRIAALLQQMGAAGERALLLFPASRDYLDAFFGCMYAGVIAVPAYPPAQGGKPVDRIRGIIEDSGARFALVDSAFLSAREEMLRQAPSLAALQMIAVDQVAAGMEGIWEAPDIGPESVSYLQYTSGSTGAPKGVMITHGNLLHNVQVIQRAMGLTPSDRGLFWLPIYHDMGLVGGIMNPIYTGFPVDLHPPIWFIRSPERWLHAISERRILLSGAPNFAFELCVRRLAGGAKMPESMDLSSWRVAFCGAEPIRADTFRRFAEAFRPYGFSAEQFHPCYGLAEATLMISGGRRGLLPEICTFDPNAFSADSAIEVVDGPGLELVASGEPLYENVVRIVDPEARTELPPGRIGEIWLAGPSIAPGYWGRPEETEAHFGATLAAPTPDLTEEGTPRRYLRTGDKGFFLDGLLFVAGRTKELLIIRGKNHYPQDIERTVEGCHPLFSGCMGAAFSVDVDNEERIALVFEIGQNEAPLAELVAAARAAITQAHDLRLYALTLIRRGTLPRTSSGKIQRLKIRAAFLAGNIEALGTWVSPTPSATTA